MGLIEAIADRPTYIDANIFIYAVEGTPLFATTLDDFFKRIARGDQSAVTSELTLAEVLVKPFADASEERQRAFEEYVK